MSVVEQARRPAPRERLTAPQREWVARRLTQARGRDPHLASRLADALEVSPNRLRALRRRMERGEELSPTRGRPRISEEERARVRALVERELECQGKVGWRAVLEGIKKREGKGTVSTMLVQEVTAAAKRRSRASKRRALERARVSHEVIARDAVWAQDATHLGRLLSGEKVEAEIATDRATTKTVTASPASPVSGEELVGLLERTRIERGCLPLVWQSDRGSAYCSDVVERYLAAEGVIHLVSRPHAPTDNPAAEAKNRELKQEAGLGSGTRLRDTQDAAERICGALERIDAGRLRATRGYRTADELDREMPRAQGVVDRWVFYEDACSAMEAAVLGLSDIKQIRKAQQDAIWTTLEKHGLARTHVGPRRLSRRKPPPVAPQAAGVECRGGHAA